MKTLGIFGDSFGVVTTRNLHNSWVDLLGTHYKVVNHCQCGVGEYKILQQLKSVDLTNFDNILITHTSPTRVYVKYNPLHQDTQYHKNCDLILADVEASTGEFAEAARAYFKHIFDIDYAFDMHNLICKEIDELTKYHNVTHITHFDYTGLYQFPNLMNFHKLFLENRGKVTHYNAKGNIAVYEKIFKRLSS